MYSQEFLDEMKQALLAEKERLETDLADLHAHTEMGDGDIDEEASEVEIDEVNKDLIETLSKQSELVMKALEKMDDGTYGVDESGKVISEERLRAMPWADKAL